MRRAIVFAAAVLALALCATAVADIPETMSYQGVLRDEYGNPVPDDTYFIIFRLYDVEAGGTPLWEEPQSIPVAGGIMNAHLGSVVTLTTLDFLVPYWLSVQIADGAELTPRIALETAPYAAHAAFADNFTGGVWEVDGDNVYHQVGNVGIGTEMPEVRLDVLTTGDMAADFSNAAAGDTTTIRAMNARGTAAAFYSCVPGDPSAPPVNTAIYASGRCGARAGHFTSTSAEAIYAQSGSVTGALVAETTNTGAHSAQFTGGLGILVDGTAGAGGFTMPSGAGAGYVLTSDASGVGSWQAFGGSDADWVISGSNMYSGVTGYVGIGDSTPDAKLDVYTTAAVEALLVEDAGAPGRVVNINRTSLPTGGNDLLQIAAPAGSPDDFQYIECERGGAADFQVYGSGRVYAKGGTFSSDVDVSTSSARAGNFVTSLGSSDAHAVHGECTAVGGFDPIGVYGKSVPGDYYGVGGYFQGGYRGVVGYIQPTGANSYRGVYGQVSGGTGSNYGVYGSATSGTNNYGVYGSASGGTNNYAGYFGGNVNVTGTLTAAVKSFKIDHPLDPTGKYLQHSCVESDEMADMYTGNVVLDARGAATVTLPDWFEALNQDFRYQLTCVGGFAPVYVAKEIAGNVFEIAGGEPGMKVSWMVTGIRHDAYARAHAIEVEVAKSVDEVGKYAHPDAYGMPETAGVDYREADRPLPQGGEPVQPMPVFDPSDGE